MAFPSKFRVKVEDLISKLKKPGKDDRRKVIHPFKVGIAITLVSSFYYIKPLYDDFGPSAMWAVFTVVVVSEFTVGATIGKGFNRGLATFLGGVSGLGSHFLVNSISTGPIMEPILLGTLVYLTAAGVTYFRFLPQLKARYDHGLVVFILTFCMVSVSSYREQDILGVAIKRAIAILMGGLISVSTSIVVYPIWAGVDLHNLESKNIEKLANFLKAFGEEYFLKSDGGESNKSFLQGYKSVLTSKQVEESWANFARWEPCHGCFGYHHPWKQYLKIGSLSRQCAYRIDALNGVLNSKTPLDMKSKIPESCMEMSTETGKALKELAEAIRKMIPPYAANTHIAKSKIAATKVTSIIRTELCEDTNNQFEVIPVLTVASLLVDVVSCTEKLAESIQELSNLAKFKNNKVVAEQQHKEEHSQPCCDNNGPQHEHVITMPNEKLS